MIHKHIQTINEQISSLLPRKCDRGVWFVQLGELGKLMWSSQDKGPRIHNQDDEWIVRDDQFDLQTVHLIDRVRKSKVEYGVPVYTIECSLLGVGTTKTGGLLALSAFENLEFLNLYASDFDNNTERILSSYWGIDRETFGQNPDYNAFRISYTYTLPTLDREDLMALEGLTDLD